MLMGGACPKKLRYFPQDYRLDKKTLTNPAESTLCKLLLAALDESPSLARQCLGYTFNLYGLGCNSTAGEEFGTMNYLAQISKA
jgi:hypothetical protein